MSLGVEEFKHSREITPEITFRGSPILSEKKLETECATEIELELNRYLQVCFNAQSNSKYCSKTEKM